jgi:hypothetical protein
VGLPRVRVREVHTGWLQAVPVASSSPLATVERPATFDPQKSAGLYFEAEDAEQENTISAELISHRRRLVDEWNAWRTRYRGEVAGTTKTAGSIEQGKAMKEIEIWVEEFIDEVEEEIID